MRYDSSASFFYNMDIRGYDISTIFVLNILDEELYFYKFHSQYFGHHQGVTYFEVIRVQYFVTRGYDVTTNFVDNILNAIT
jgi:hypothetical protein